MRILLSAYACEPNRGSEPGIGWKWALNLSTDKNKDVHVLTRANNRDVIEKFFGERIPNNLHFHYYDLPGFIIWLKHHGFPVNIYYALWLYGSGRLAMVLHQEYKFDMAHHITFGVFRDACMLYKLGIPYVVGPLGGGETTPKKLCSLFSIKERIIEVLRSLSNNLALYNPLLIKSFNNASLILTKTKDTKNVLHRWSQKTFIKLEIGINEICPNVASTIENCFLFVGRFTYWKGIKLVLLSFAQYHSNHPNAKLVLVGKGEMEQYIREFSKAHNIEKKVQIIPWIDQIGLKRYYQESRALIFPSLHDSSGNVVLEALSFGLPVICLDCGGPASILGEDLKDTVVSTYQKEINEVVNDIVDKMNLLSADSKYYQSIQNKCLSRAHQMQWCETVRNSYLFIQDKLFPHEQ